MFKKLTSFFSKLHFSLGKKIRNLFQGKAARSLDHLEELFFEADLGSTLSYELIETVRYAVKKDPDLTGDAILQLLKEKLLQVLKESPPLPFPTTSPHVILVVGTNGSGKTTSIAKLANYFARQGKKVAIAACDTYRAAALEQLKRWAERTHVALIGSQPKSDPSSVAFDALSSAKAKNIDIVLIDTAGRLETRNDLMKELEKIGKVCKKIIPDAPHETLLVLDATIGQNALSQAEIFHQFTPITGIILSKLDGTAKGGIAVSIKKELHLNVLWVGLGEKEGDFAPFDAEEFVEALLS